LRKPFQVLIIPFIREKGKYYYAVFRRKDLNIWQFIAGGGEDNETPIETVKREAYEEVEINRKSHYVRLASICAIPVVNIRGLESGKEIIMIPEFSFAVKLFSKKLKISNAHSQYLWLNCENAIKKLRYDIDFVLSGKNQTPYIIETNMRRTGGTHIFDTAKSIFGEDWDKKTFIISQDSFYYGKKILSEKFIFKKMKEILFPVNKDKKGVIISIVNKWQPTFGFIIIEKSSEAAVRMYSKIKNIWNVKN